VHVVILCLIKPEKTDLALMAAITTTLIMRTDAAARRGGAMKRTGNGGI